MEQIELIKQYAQALRLTKMKNDPEGILHDAQLNNPGYVAFAKNLLEREVKHRQQTDLQRRIKMARLPHHHLLDRFDHNYDNGISASQLKQLRELLWLEQNYNLILMGPSGIGKTFIASGLVYEAVMSGYRAYFMTMDELIQVLKLKNITSKAMNMYNRLIKCHLLAIDDIMLFPIEKNQAVELFNLINQLHEKASIIITTNKSPKEWAQTLEDEVLATALLDRLLYRCEVVRLNGKSYRMENRKTIFESN